MDTDGTTDSSNPDSPVINLDTPPGSVGNLPEKTEKTVDEGISDSRKEMAGLNVTDRINLVRAKTIEHTRSGLIISEECRLRMKEHRGSVEHLLGRSKALHDELNTVQFYINAALKRTSDFQTELENHLKIHDAAYSKIKQRDGHLDFVLKLVDMTVADLQESWEALNSNVESLENENRSLRERNYKLKGNYFRKRNADSMSRSSGDIEFVSLFTPSKHPKMEVDLTGDSVETPSSSSIACSITPVTPLRKDISILTPSVLPTSSIQLGLEYLGLTPRSDTSSKIELKPESKESKPLEFSEEKMIIEDKPDEIVKTELNERQIALFEKLQQGSHVEKEETSSVLESTTATPSILEIKDSTSNIDAPVEAIKTDTPSTSVATPSTSTTSTAAITSTSLVSTTSSKQQRAISEEYEKKASEEREKQKLIAGEIAKKKEAAAKKQEIERRESEERREREKLEKSPPQTLIARKVSDGFEIRYLTANLVEFKERVPRYMDSDWPELSPTMLQDLLPSPICVRFVYGKGLKRQGTMDTVHIDHRCPRSHVTYKMLDGAIEKTLGRQIDFKLTWGRCREFTCKSYVDAEFLDPPTSKMHFPIRLCVVEDPGYDRNRITLGYDFVSQYIHSKKGSFEAGDILLGDRLGYWWATTYQRKAGHN